MARSRWKGMVSLRRLWRQFPDDVRGEVIVELNLIGRRQLGRAKAETPTLRGWLRSALAFKVLPKSLRLQLGLLTKALRRRYFYGYILDQGRRAQVAQAKRPTRSGKVSSYAIRVRGIARDRYDFVFGRRRDFVENELPGLRTVYDRALRKLAAGPNGD